MRFITRYPKTTLALLGLLAAPAYSGLSAQQMETQQEPAEAGTVVTGSPPADITGLAAGPDIKGMISARKDDRILVTGPDGAKTPLFITEATEVRSSSGLFGLGQSKLASESLLNGLPVTAKTVQWGGGLIATQIKVQNKDLKTASMIRTGTEQGFSEQTAATEALRSRVADIDQYNVKGTTNVYFDTGKWNLTPAAQADLCAAAAQANATENALMLVVGYTDSVGDYDYNQALSEKRAAKVVNHLQQACGWKPYRMLTPTGMAEADPTADNNTEAGKAQNRRVAINILVSKSVDGF
ncbi:outer membrane protein OmpA-like peptidoglycan-associated protein [Sphingorhabdus rigui]|uniref:Outer membrane protein OmpA-like peptidoglycan-associated protein n=1 Tax=Sphingorhabdus rigui TaxID=1282858 RepID=A0A840AY24_9SPHN|nr:OmpA family protein [Sphingorhabdus rigui]MBB3941932.1 outer membrane protein OmpA-like peptidoglycan-associated protein [Sphingorhabdus rigui]